MTASISKIARRMNRLNRFPMIASGTLSAAGAAGPAPQMGRGVTSSLFFSRRAQTTDAGGRVGIGVRQPLFVEFNRRLPP
jgi:hypothetical protein